MCVLGYFTQITVNYLVLWPIVDPPLHLHWWWGNHECDVLMSAGSEKPRCLVSTSYVSCCFLLMLNETSVCVNGVVFVVRWDRKNNPEPWNKIEPNQQYKVGVFLHIWRLVLMYVDHLLVFYAFCYMVRLSTTMFCGKQAISVPYLFYYLVSKSILPSSC